MPVNTADPDASIEWDTAVVDSRSVDFAAGGDGELVVFLHGWGLSPRAYRSSLASLVNRGFRVIAPTLPGLGGSAELEPSDRTFDGYAKWVGRFLDAIGVNSPVTVVGHSFGGGVAAAVAHDRPTLVSQLVLVNSVGGGAWSHSSGREYPIRKRPLLNWCGSAIAEAIATFPARGPMQLLLDEVVPNAVRNAGSLWRTANLARNADLIALFETMAERAMPVSMLWSVGDQVIPRASFDAIRAALVDPRVHEVRGNHNWLIDDAELFGQLLTHVLSDSATELVG
ncbi:UNVERIFIED_ORG: pimeloyl-ACP methyl ester carboxylesterase [Nocardia globerula]|uniref:Pimeloyl-ACP methyl ester carboxylesterase n=1 Tax=Nocardia globerula TaxID=1818 RepID=A0A652YTV9_NOCGL|nr:alpha/beta fold hydrolase [Rhodococcus globerulus]NMD60951.1 alpha/beta hydrolase [Nocardia globerula]PVX67501.1 pimeloyl-ACP methyl ester carboxylesterase [Rhodococcus globerulus]